MKTIFNDNYRELIKQLKEARKRRGLSQLAVARRLGVSRSLVQKYECAEVRLDVLGFVRLCKAINLDPGRLVKNMATALK